MIKRTLNYFFPSKEKPKKFQIYTRESKASQAPATIMIERAREKRKVAAWNHVWSLLADGVLTANDLYKMKSDEGEWFLSRSMPLELTKGVASEEKDALIDYLEEEDRVSIGAPNIERSAIETPSMFGEERSWAPNEYGTMEIKFTGKISSLVKLMEQIQKSELTS